MEQNKLETQFKEKLNSREIKPTEMAWDRLDAMLSAVEKPKRKSPWFYIAASFVGLLLVGTIFLNQKENTIENQKNTVVIQPSIETKRDEKPSNPLDINSENNKGSLIPLERIVAEKVSKILILNKDSLTNKNSSSQIAEVSIINQKENQESIPTQTNSITNTELLARIDQSARLKNETNSNSEVHINAKHLLQQAEKDLEPTFRQNVFSRLADNFKIVKEAVANRNKE